MKVKVWITKYALTKGLFEMQAELANGGKYASGTHERMKLFTREFARTRDEAVKVALQMRDARIASLKKALKKMEKLTF